MEQVFLYPLSQNFNTTRFGDWSLVGHPSVHGFHENIKLREN